MILLLPDNKTITVTCEVVEATPQAECLVTLNCTKCQDNLFTKSFRGSVQLPVLPAEHYLITVQAVRADDGEPLEDYTVKKTLQIPKSNEILQHSDNTGMPV